MEKMNEPITLRMREGKSGGGKGPLYQVNKSGTLGCINDQVVFTTDMTEMEKAECYAFDMGAGKTSVSMGENVCPTLATTHDGAPAVAINTPKPIGGGTGSSTVGFYPQMKAEAMTPLEEKSPTLVNGTCPGWWNGVMERNYILRRLTPTECARLQGFPDWWCEDLGEDEPDLEFWRGVWDTWCDIEGKKHKTDKEILRWLKDPYSEAEEYKMWGNGVALPCVEFVMKGIAAWEDGKIPEEDEELPLLAWFNEARDES